MFPHAPGEKSPYTILLEVRKAIDTDDVNIVQEAGNDLLEYYFIKLSQLKNQPSNDSIILGQAPTFLRSINGIVKSKVYPQIAQTNERFELGIYKICSIILSQNRIDNSIEVYKRIIKLMTYILSERNVSKWGFMFKNFIMKDIRDNPRNRSNELNSSFKTKFYILLEYLQKKKDTLVRFWWAIIINSLLPIVIQADVIVESQTDIELPKYIIPDDFRIALNKFITTPSVISAIKGVFELYNTHPFLTFIFYNTFIVLTEFYFNSPPKFDFTNGIQAFNDIFDFYIDNKFISVDEFLQSIFKDRMNVVVEFVALSARLMSSNCIKLVQKKILDDSIEYYMKLCRKRWQTLIKDGQNREFVTCVMNQIDSTKLEYIYSIVFFLLVFDFKITDLKFWKWFGVKPEFYTDKVVIMFRKLIAIFGVAFSPVFLGLNREDIENFCTRVKQRNARNNPGPVDEKAEKPINEMFVSLFTNANEIQERIIPDPQFYAEFNAQIDKSKYYIPPIYCEGWDLNLAKKFLYGFIFNSPYIPELFNSFLTYLSYCAQIIPLSLHTTATAISESFFNAALPALIDYKYNTDALHSIAMSARHIYMINSYELDDNVADQWITMIIRYLCLNDVSFVNFTIPIAVEAFLNLSPRANILAIFILNHLQARNISIPLPIKYSFMLSALGVFNHPLEVRFPRKIEENKASFDLKKENKDLFEGVWNQSRSDSSTLVNKILVMAFVEPGVKSMKNDDIRFDLLFNAFFSVVLENVLAAEPMYNMDEVVKDLTDDFCIDKLAKGNIMELCYLTNFISELEEKFDGFTGRFCKLAILASLNTNKIWQIIMIVILVSKLVRNYNASNKYSIQMKKSVISKFRKAIKEATNKIENEEHRNYILCAAMYGAAFGEKIPPPVPGIEYDIFAVRPEKSLIGISNLEDEKFDYTFRNHFIYCKSTIHSISKKPKFENPNLPEETNIEDEIERNSVNLSNILSKYTNCTKLDPSKFNSYKDHLKADNIKIEEQKSIKPRVSKVSAPKRRVKSKSPAPIDNTQPPPTIAHSSSTHGSNLNLVEIETISPPEIDLLMVNGIKSRSFFSFMKHLCVGGMDYTPATKTNVRYASPAFNLSPREIHKIGVIYVSDKQISQEEILSNTSANSSEAFNSFLTALGTVVDLNTHKFYAAKLEPNDKFPYSIYYDDNQYEVMFHVSTLLPNNENDPQRILKKKHIGNDNVHIIWCENPIGYDSTIITSQFNDVHIIIQPYIDKLFRVRIKRKQSLNDVGPLPDETVIPDYALVPLVREAAIILDRYTREDVDCLPCEQFENLFEPIAQKF